MKNPSESFDRLRTNGSKIEVLAKNLFMLSFSKHVPLFSAACQSCAMDCFFGRKHYSVTGCDVNPTRIRERGWVCDTNSPLIKTS